jgi:hypothetical protein
MQVFLAAAMERALSLSNVRALHVCILVRIADAEKRK